MKFIKKIQYNSPVILTYALISLAALGLGRLTNGESTRLVFSVYRGPLTDPLAYVRLFAYVAGHADLPHYLNNFLIILLIGPVLEEKYGSRNTVFMILITAFVTGAVNMAFFNTALLGASGIVFMLILLGSFVNLKKGRIPVTLLLIMAVYIGREIADGIYLADNVSQLGHVIGGFCGALLGFFLNKDILFDKKTEVISESPPGEGDGSGL